jgi:HPt (histidine-containing phosphotransfer) domain-containing protein
MPEAPAINPQALEDLRTLSPGDGDAFLREIVALYLSDTPAQLAKLDRSLAAGDAEGFTRAAHSLKGSSANLGASAVRSAAERLERCARHEGLAGVQPLLVETKAEFARACAELQQLLPPPPDPAQR